MSISFTIIICHPWIGCTRLIQTLHSWISDWARYNASSVLWQRAPAPPDENTWWLLPHQHTIKSNYSLKKTPQARIGHHQKVRIWISNELSNADYSLRTRLYVWDRSVALWACVYVIHLPLRVHSWQLFWLNHCWPTHTEHNRSSTLCWQWRGNERKQEMMFCGQRRRKKK